MAGINHLDPCQACNGSGTSIHPLRIVVLAVAVLDLLEAASDLPEPSSITAYGKGLDHVTLLFPPAGPSAAAIIQWSLRFGGTVTSETRQDEYTEGRPERWTSTEFGWYGITVRAFAHIPVTQAGDETDEPAHADYPHEPGRLYGCPACEAACHCTPGDAECVYSGPHNGQAAT